MLLLGDIVCSVNGGQGRGLMEMGQSAGGNAGKQHGQVASFAWKEVEEWVIRKGGQHAKEVGAKAGFQSAIRHQQITTDSCRQLAPR
jgi:hypothetical protein